MMIDNHIHLTALDEDKPIALKDGLLSEMDRNSVAKAIIVSSYPSISIDQVATVINEHPNRFIAFGDINGVEPLEDQINNMVSMGFKGFKLYPSKLEKYPGDEMSLRLATLAADLKFPIQIHTSPFGPGHMKYNLPIYIDDLASNVPTCNIIMLHLGGNYFLDAISVARKHPNVFIDLSVSVVRFKDSPYWEQIMWALKTLPPSKLIYGSDFPRFTMTQTIQCIRSMGFDSNDEKLILGGNIASLLKL